MEKTTLAVDWVDLDAIHPDPANARVHDKRNLDEIKGSLARFGQQKPIVVDRSGTIRAGNGDVELRVAADRQPTMTCSSATHIGEFGRSMKLRSSESRSAAACCAASIRISAPPAIPQRSTFDTLMRSPPQA